MTRLDVKIKRIADLEQQLKVVKETQRKDYDKLVFGGISATFLRVG